MKGFRRGSLARFVFALVLAGVALAAYVQLGTGEALAAKDPVCVAQKNCGRNSPPVLCSDGNVYRNICKANAACQYDCVSLFSQ